MTPQQIVGLGIRLFAIWLFLVGLPYVWYIPSYLARQPIDGSGSGSIVIGFIYIAIAIVLWFFPMVVAHRLIPRTNFDNVLRVAPIEAAKVGCCLQAYGSFLPQPLRWSTTCFEHFSFLVVARSTAASV